MSKKILLVDDDPMIRVFTLNALKKDFEVLAAEDVIDGLFHLEKGFLPNLILLDIHLPMVNGDTLLDRIEQYHFARSLPIVVISASENFTDFRKEYQHGPLAFLPKPFHASTLRSTIDSLLTIAA